MAQPIEGEFDVFNKIKYSCTLWPGILSLGIYPQDILVKIWNDLCTKAYTKAIFVIANNREQPKWISIAKWLNYDIFLQ